MVLKKHDQKYPYFQGWGLVPPSQTIYGGGGIQVAEVGAIDANKTQRLWSI